jgi:fatty acid desaturase
LAVTADTNSPDGAESIQAHKRPPLPDAFREKSSTYGAWITFKTLAPIIITVVLVGWLMPQTIWGVVVAGIVLGWAAYRTQFLFHDASHMSLFASRAANDRAGSIAGLLVGIYFPRYRKVHFLHHKYNGLLEDPQLPDYLSERQLSRWGYAKFVFEPLIGGRVIPYLRRDMLESKVVSIEIPSPPVSWFVKLLMVQAILLTILTSGWSKPFYALSFYGGMATVSLFLARLRTLAEHQQVGTTYTDFSRTHPVRLVDALFLHDANFSYHMEHHLYPAIQSRHYPAVFQTVTSEMHSQDSCGSSMFSTLFATFKRLPATLKDSR